MNMTRKQTDFYLKRLRLFRSPSQIARMMKCTQPSVDRWLEGKGLPRHSMLKKFEIAFEDLKDWLRGQGFVEVAIALDEEPPTGSEAHRYSTIACQAFLRDLLEKPMRYLDILSEAKKRKFTRSQIDYAAMKIGVHRKMVVAKDKRSYSLWSLIDAND